LSLLCKQSKADCPSPVQPVFSSVSWPPVSFHFGNFHLRLLSAPICLQCHQHHQRKKLLQQMLDLKVQTLKGQQLPRRQPLVGNVALTKIVLTQILWILFLLTQILTPRVNVVHAVWMWLMRIASDVTCVKAKFVRLAVV